MKNRAMNKLACWPMGLVLMAPLAAWAAEDIDRTLDVASDALVRVENVAGSVGFTAWDRDEVRIKGRIGDDVEEVEIETTSDGIRVQVRNKRNQRRIDSTHLELSVPKGARIDAEGVSADLTVSGLEGESLNLETVSGDIEVKAASHRVDLATVSGDVEFDGSAERMKAESVSGDLILIGVRNDVEASTVSGEITLDAGVVENGRFETVSGEISLLLELADKGRLDCDAMSGDISLRLPSEQQASFLAQTYSGSINSEFGKPAKNSGSPSGSILKTQSGDNGARIRLETFSGDISIRAQ